MFLPDLGLGRMTWMPTVRKLLAGHRVVIVDLPGHGDSPMLDPFSFPAAAAALDQVLAKEKGESTIVIGQGVGGIIAAYEAKAHPERLKGLVLIDLALKFPIKIEDQQRAMFLKWMDENYDAFIRQASGQRGRDSTQSAEILAQVALIPPANLKPYFREQLSADAMSALKGFPRPVLYVGTARGWAADKTWAVLAAERGLEVFGAADTLRIPDSATLVMKDQPDTLATAIARFAAKALATK